MSPAEMPAGRALDALVAEKVMGWRCVAEGQYGRLIGKTAQGGFGENGALRDVPRYSTDIAAAWLVVERMRAVGHFCHVAYFTARAAWRAEFTTGDGDAWADTAPLAICRAALAASDTTERPDRLSAVREAETECHAEERADG